MPDRHLTGPPVEPATSGHTVRQLLGGHHGFHIADLTQDDDGTWTGTITAVDTQDARPFGPFPTRPDRGALAEAATALGVEESNKSASRIKQTARALQAITDLVYTSALGVIRDLDPHSVPAADQPATAAGLTASPPIDWGTAIWWLIDGMLLHPNDVTARLRAVAVLLARQPNLDVTITDVDPYGYPAPPDQTTGLVVTADRLTLLAGDVNDDVAGWRPGPDEHGWATAFAATTIAKRLLDHLDHLDLDWQPTPHPEIASQP